MCIQKDEDLIEVNFSRRKIKKSSLIRKKMMWKLQQIYSHHIFEWRQNLGGQFLWVFQNRHDTIQYHLQGKGLFIPPKKQPFAHSPPGFQRRVVVSKAKLALNIITTRVDSTRVLRSSAEKLLAKILMSFFYSSGCQNLSHLGLCTKSFERYFSYKYVISKSLKVCHWLSEKCH